MSTTYTIEVPLYSHSIDLLKKYNQNGNIRIIVYGGFPDSPLNGGRFNFSLDGIFLWDRLFLELRPRQLTRLSKRFYETVSQANKNGMPFLLAFTNMFVDKEDLNDANLAPVKWLVEAAEEHGVKNGVIINNQFLENHLREMYGDRLTYVSSCTKYVCPQRILPPSMTMEMYKQDTAKYDYVVLTPQDSRREKLLNDLLPEYRDKIVAISNAYCSFKCNSYHHYKITSEENKKTLLTYDNVKGTGRMLSFILSRLNTCSAVWQIFRPVEVEKIARMQIGAGVVNFKLGRGVGANLLDRLVDVILDFANSREDQR